MTLPTLPEVHAIREENERLKRDAREHQELEEHLRDKLKKAEERVIEWGNRFSTVTAVVIEQALDEGLWSMPIGRMQTIAEAHLQQELRRLHAAIENAFKK